MHCIQNQGLYWSMALALQLCTYCLYEVHGDWSCCNLSNRL